MTEHDGQVGQVLNKLKELGLEENTIVVYTTDNGAEVFSWPDGGMTPFRNEKNSNWEGGYRVPALVRWPGTIKPGTQINDITSLEDSDAHIDGGRWRAGHQDEAADRPYRRRPDLQGASSTVTT